MSTHYKKISVVVLHVLLMIVGSSLYAAGLKYFLIPNSMIDGGITGISIISSYFTHIPLGVYILIFNIPFLFIGYKNIGKTFTFSTLFSVICVSIMSSILNPVKGITNEPLLASIFGGIILGIGVGLIIRSGGSSDGIEVIAIFLDKKSSFSVGQIIMIFNVFILGSAGFIFGWDRAMYSLVAYFITSKTIDITVNGLDETRTLTIISDKYKEITEQLLKESSRGITLIEGKGGYSSKPTNVVFIVASRLEITNIKTIIYKIDKNSLIIIQDAEVSGKNFENLGDI